MAEERVLDWREHDRGKQGCEVNIRSRNEGEREKWESKRRERRERKHHFHGMLSAMSEQGAVGFLSQSYTMK